MKKEILEAGEKVIERIKRLIIERTKPGDTIMLPESGNTIASASRKRQKPSQDRKNT